MWEIGVPDRSAAEFFIPDQYPIYMNNLYTNMEKYVVSHPDLLTSSCEISNFYVTVGNREDQIINTA
jgi:Polysaccharide lyase family 4, domain III